jgi:hypothetical protein
MPDLLTHTAAAHLIIRPLGLRFRDRWPAHVRLLFYFGAMLPDLLTRPWYIILPSTHDWTSAFHTPAGLLLVSALLALAFEPSLRKPAFGMLLSGGFLHFFMDSFQKQLVGGHFWLFPFSWHSWGFGLAWADELIPFIPVWLAAALLMEGWVLWKTKRKQKILTG